MDWNTVLQYVPEGLCALLCLFGCLCNWVRTGSIKNSIEKLCPSFELVVKLSERVDMLEKRLDDISSAIEGALGGDHGSDSGSD